MEFKDNVLKVEIGMSVEDRKAMKIMNQSATLVNDQYQIRLPFRKDVPNLPESRTVAEKRLTWLKKGFDKDINLHAGNGRLHDGMFVRRSE